MLIVSQNLINYDFPIPDNAIYSINLAWVNNLEDLSELLSKHSKDITDLERKLINAFSTASTSPKYNKSPTVISFILQLGADTKINNGILAAYKEYTKITPIPKIGLIIDYGKGKISDVSEILAEIISLGGHVLFAKEQTSSKGVLRAAPLCGSNQGQNIHRPCQPR